MCDHPRQPLPWAPWKSLPCAWPKCGNNGAPYIVVLKLSGGIEPLTLWSEPPDFKIRNGIDVIFERRTWKDYRYEQTVHEWVRRD